jgi:aspartate aminotransferase
MQLSNRVLSAPESPIRKLVPFADQAKASGTHVYHLNIGQPDIPTPQAMWDAVAKADIKVLSYSPSGGIPELRSAMIDYYKRYDIALDQDQFIVTTAGSEAILFALAAICDPGDDIVVSEPFYANYNGYGALLNVGIKAVTAVPENGYALPPVEEWEARITPRTKALMICNPCNPTGRVYNRDELNILIALAKRHDLYIISDEVYREFCYSDESPISIMSFPEIADRAIMVDSISKRFSACGARIGSVASYNRDLIAGALKFAQSRLSPPTLGQVMAAAAYRLPPTYFDDVIEAYRKRRDVVLEEIGKIPGVICQQPAGAFYIFAKLPLDNAEEFVKWMLTDFSDNGETTMMAPGAGFYANPGMGEAEVRIAYVLEEERCRRAIQLVAMGLAAYKKTVSV